MGKRYRLCVGAGSLPENRFELRTILPIALLPCVGRRWARQPKQQRGKERVEKILDAAAAVFDEVGYEAATTHLIAAKAETAVGSLYQFFPDKAAIFNAMELRHVERVKAMWAQANTPKIVQSPLREMIHTLVTPHS